MMIARAPHRWNVTPKTAAGIQARLAPLISLKATSGAFRLVAGADIAFTTDGSRAVAAVVVWDVAEKRVIETRTAIKPLDFPYVPGLLTFREGPALLAAMRKLRCTPDAFLFDGQGFAHPRRFGLACHMGLLIDRPAAGCGKSRLIGEHEAPGRRRGSFTPLTDAGETVGAVVRTRDDVNPVYVSVGHRMSLQQAIDLVLDCSIGFRVPEPTRLADRLVARLKTQG